MNNPLNHNELVDYFYNEVDFEAIDAPPHWLEADKWLGIRPAVWGLLGMLTGAVGTLYALTRLVMYLRELLQTLNHA